jgi:hypothetical protein
LKHGQEEPPNFKHIQMLLSRNAGFSRPNSLANVFLFPAALVAKSQKRALLQKNSMRRCARSPTDLTKRSRTRGTCQLRKFDIRPFFDGGFEGAEDLVTEVKELMMEWQRQPFGGSLARMVGCHFHDHRPGEGVLCRSGLSGMGVVSSRPRTTLKGAMLCDVMGLGSSVGLFCS